MLSLVDFHGNKDWEVIEKGMTGRTAQHCEYSYEQISIRISCYFENKAFEDIVSDDDDISDSECDSNDDNQKDDHTINTVAQLHLLPWMWKEPLCSLNKFRGESLFGRMKDLLMKSSQFFLLIIQYKAKLLSKRRVKACTICLDVNEVMEMGVKVMDQSKILNFRILRLTTDMASRILFTHYQNYITPSVAELNDGLSISKSYWPRHRIEFEKGDWFSKPDRLHSQMGISGGRSCCSFIWYNISSIDCLNAMIPNAFRATLMNDFEKGSCRFVAMNLVRLKRALVESCDAVINLLSDFCIMQTPEKKSNLLALEAAIEKAKYVRSDALAIRSHTYIHTCIQ